MLKITLVKRSFVKYKYLFDAQRKMNGVYGDWESFNVIDPQLDNLIKRMLRAHPDDRPTAAQILADPYFKGMNPMVKYGAQQENTSVCLDRLVAGALPILHINPKQVEISVYNVAELIDWIYTVTNTFTIRLNKRSLFKTFNLIYMMLASDYEITQQNLQLLGVACILTAGYMEEITPPDVSDIKFITRR